MFRPQSRLCVYSLAVRSFGFRRKDRLPPETRGRNTHDNSSAERSPCPRRRQSRTKSWRGKVTKVLHPVWQQDINASSGNVSESPQWSNISVNLCMMPARGQDHPPFTNSSKGSCAAGWRASGTRARTKVRQVRLGGVLRGDGLKSFSDMHPSRQLLQHYFRNVLPDLVLVCRLFLH